MEEDEISNPSPRKVLTDRIIYATRAMPLTGGEPILADLGEARLAKQKQTGLIMPSAYRAPEVLLGMEWDNKVDIWGLGQMVRLLIPYIIISNNYILYRHGHCLSKDIFSEIKALKPRLRKPSVSQK